MRTIDLQVPRGAFLVILAGIFWGTMGVLAKVVFLTGAVGPLGLSFWRGAIAVPIMFVFVLLTHSRLPRIPRKDLMLFLAFGVVSYALFQSLYMSAFARTTVAHAAALLYVAPIFVAIFSYLIFNERIAPRKILGIVLAILGASLVVGLSHGSQIFDSATFLGDMFAIAAGIAYSTWFIFGKLLGRRYSPSTMTVLVMLVGTITLFPLTASLEPNSFSGLASVWHLMLVIALVPTSAAYIIYLHGLRLIEPTKASVYATIEPIAAAVTAYTFFQESLSIDGFLGVGLILLSIVVVSYSNRDSV